jgi:EAL domain-containing protein (putative c-di-GMP-specific phosphodiesterase class I)
MTKIGKATVAYEPLYTAPDRRVHGFAVRVDPPAIADVEHALRAVPWASLGWLRIVVDVSGADLRDGSLLHGPVVEHARSCMLAISEADAGQGLDVIAMAQVHRRAGYEIGIRDFGAGWGCFSLMSALQPDMIVLPESLVRTLHRDTYRMVVVESIARAALDLGVNVAAQGIRTRAELKAILRCGVNVVASGRGLPRLVGETLRNLA